MNHRKISTPLTRLLGIKLPIISAPMAFAATAELASAVTAAGGFGFMGAGFLSSDDLKKNLQTARQHLGLKDGDVVPVGIGFLGFLLDITESSNDPRLEAILAEKPSALLFAYGPDLGKYVARVQQYDSTREHKTVIFATANSVEEALAAREWKVDVIVAQGIEAGGHGKQDSPPLLTLIEAVKQAVPTGPLIVAAGGISTGAQIAGLLTIGVAGVILGTRFLFTHECVYSPVQKDALIKAGLTSSVRSLAFDEVGRTKWPSNHDGRALANKIVEDEKEGLDYETRLKRYDESKAAGDLSRLIVWAGAGVGLTSSVTSAKDVVRDLVNQTVDALQRASTLAS